MSTSEMTCPKHPRYKGERRTRKTDPGCYCIRVYDAKHPLGRPHKKPEGETLYPIVLWLQDLRTDPKMLPTGAYSRWRMEVLPDDFEGGYDTQVSEEWMEAYHRTSALRQQDMLRDLAEEIKHKDWMRDKRGVTK